MRGLRGYLMNCIRRVRVTVCTFEVLLIILWNSQLVCRSFISHFKRLNFLGDFYTGRMVRGGGGGGKGVRQLCDSRCVMSAVCVCVCLCVCVCIVAPILSRWSTCVLCVLCAWGLGCVLPLCPALLVKAARIRMPKRHVQMCTVYVNCTVYTVHYMPTKKKDLHRSLDPSRQGRVWGIFVGCFKTLDPLFAILQMYNFIS